MAGSYNHVVTDKGNLRTNEAVVRALENGGDVFEAVEEMFGMIWYLAVDRIGPFPKNETPEAMRIWCETASELVNDARKNYRQGLVHSIEVHKFAPGKRRD